MTAPVAVVFAYGGFGYAGIAALLQAGARVALVLTHADQPGENCWWRSTAGLCAAHGIPVLFDADLAGDGPGTAVERIRALAPDYLFSFYFRHLISERVLALAGRGAYNLHGSLLPKYRGRAPINWQLVHGETRSGLTLHRMVKQADAGDILAQLAVEVHPDVDAFGFANQLMDHTPAFLAGALAELFAGRAVHRAQDHAQASVFAGRRPADGLIDWSWPARRVHNLVRAVAPPYPGAFAWLDGRKVMVGRTSVRSEAASGAVAGTVLPGAAGAWGVACGSGIVDLLVVSDAAGHPAWLPVGACFSPVPPQCAAGNP